jgi:hypothetical protein
VQPEARQHDSATKHLMADREGIPFTLNALLDMHRVGDEIKFTAKWLAERPRPARSFLFIDIR